ncbi:hypothetical protein TNCV_1878031 [Trichonephila clavipes]|nr:hypothetical protein TNCV_1878031 [Trichonephila clavipes]
MMGVAYSPESRELIEGRSGNGVGGKILGLTQSLTDTSRLSELHFRNEQRLFRFRRHSSLKTCSDGYGGDGRGEECGGRRGVENLSFQLSHSQTCCDEGSRMLLPWRRISRKVGRWLQYNVPSSSLRYSSQSRVPPDR